MSSSDKHFLVQGEAVTLPARFWDTAVGLALFAVPADAVRDIIGYSKLPVLEVRPGKAVCALVFIRYAASDLGAYNEFDVTFLVKTPDAGSRGLPGPLGGLKGAGAFAHRVAVDAGFTLEAGRKIWGFPKVMADIPLHLDSRVKRCAVRFDGRTAVELHLHPGLPMPSPEAVRFSAFSCMDDVTRRIPWTMAPRGVRIRPGGARVVLGDHPMADELRRLGLHNAHALGSAIVGHAELTIDAATRVAGAR
ncbi:acetoacetate decarboxylase family protein [Spirillospora sp. NPDC050679]